MNENTISCDPLEQSNDSYYLYLIEINDKDDQSMVSFMNKIDGIQKPSKINILKKTHSNFILTTVKIFEQSRFNSVINIKCVTSLILCHTRCK